MQRYLIRFAYFGTDFRGLQMQERIRRHDFVSVQGVLEAGLRYLRPINEPITHSACRTDSGVHALENALHVDLISSKPGNKPYEPQFITDHLNFFMFKCGVDIRVRSTQCVSSMFDSRFLAYKRHYIYRLAVVNSFQQANSSNFRNSGSNNTSTSQQAIISSTTNTSTTSNCDNAATCSSGTRSDNQYLSYPNNYIPLAEVNRLFIVRVPVDIEELRAGCSLLQREADFASFMKPNLHTPPGTTVKTMEHVSMSPGVPLMSPDLDPAYQNLSIFNIKFSSKSFLYNQIRKCVGVLVALAQGAITRQDIEHMFAVPHRDSWPRTAQMAPACGLYLAKVEYPAEVLQYPGGILEESVSEISRIRDKVHTMVALGQTAIREGSAGPSAATRLAKELLVLEVEQQQLQEGQKQATVGNQQQQQQQKETSEPGHLNVKSIDTAHDNCVSDELMGIRSVNKETTIRVSAPTTHGTVQTTESDADGHSQESQLERCAESEECTEVDISHASACDDRPDVVVEGEQGDEVVDLEGHQRRSLLAEVYELFKQRDAIDAQAGPILQKLVTGNVMHQLPFDEQAMEEMVAKIRRNREADKRLKLNIMYHSKLRHERYVPYWRRKAKTV